MHFFFLCSIVITGRDRAGILLQNSRKLIWSIWVRDAVEHRGSLRTQKLAGGFCKEISILKRRKRKEMLLIRALNINGQGCDGWCYSSHLWPGVKLANALQQWGPKPAKPDTWRKLWNSLITTPQRLKPQSVLLGDLFFMDWPILRWAFSDFNILTHTT